MEILQNHALRIILKKRQIDHVSVESLREDAKVQSIERRLQTLLMRYFSKSIDNNNPLIMELIKDYWNFRKRNIILHKDSPEYEAAIEEIYTTSEKNKTILCFVNQIESIRELEEDNWDDD